MSLKKRAVVHVGIHKTGSTSIQAFLNEYRAKLCTLGVHFYTGMHDVSDHIEMHTVTMRLERASPFKLNTGLAVDSAYQEMVRERVQRFIFESSCDCIVFSAEGLSYLRYEDEMERLRSIVPQCQIEIVMYLRDPVRFLESYRIEMMHHIMPPTIEPDPFAYTGNDSWLVDFESRIKGFQNAFGCENVITLNYDQEYDAMRNVIPSFLRVLGVESHFEAHHWSTVFRNRTLLKP